MLDQDTIRREFANFLATDPRIDNALAHVVKIAYQRGIDDWKNEQKGEGK